MSRKREDLVVPYHHVPAKARNDAGSMISQTLPMAAMFMRNKLMSWCAVFLALQAYLTEPINKPEDDAQAGSQPPLLRFVFALVSLSTCYLDLFFPSTNPAIKKSALSKATETVSSIVSEATS
ncbi:hypothetical protein CXQ85_000761 [Candidozyma haemuli]|uniref:Uncharacterized protein n=1 Tax=Candidozyma haemuli TaxID=45357 RepID=A0A2V1AUK3_9ASCO|nr:hypothetical protein CXQ85_000761 [[Candida] haemuloni]PVH21770.1 hypothetical protein CXQ85_000761 [[Candida] haemuloni]